MTRSVTLVMLTCLSWIHILYVSSAFRLGGLGHPPPPGGFGPLGGHSPLGGLGLLGPVNTLGCRTWGYPHGSRNGVGSGRLPAMPDSKGFSLPGISLLSEAREDFLKRLPKGSLYLRDNPQRSFTNLSGRCLESGAMLSKLILSRQLSNS